MTLENNRKILIGSLMQSLDKKLMLGETDDTPIILLSLLVDHLEFALSQQEAGVSSFNEVVQNIYAKILVLKNQCPDICFYKNRILLSSPIVLPIVPDNTPPTVNGTEILPVGGEYTFTPTDFITNYNDAEGDAPNMVIIDTLPGCGTLFYLGEEIQEGFTFSYLDASNLVWSNISETVLEYTYDVDVEQRQLELENLGFTFVSLIDGTYTYSRLGTDLIDSGVDGTFDTIPVGIGNVEGGGWINGLGTMDTLSPTSNVSQLITPATPSSQGGNFAGAITQYNPPGTSTVFTPPNYLQESMYTEVSVVAGKTYRISFEQAHAELTSTNINVGETVSWNFELDGVLAISNPIPYLGPSVPIVWDKTYVDIVAASTNSAAKLEIIAGKTSGTDLNVEGIGRSYMLIDDIKIQEISSSPEDIEQIIGTPLQGCSLDFRVSDSNSTPLYSNTASITPLNEITYDHVIGIRIQPTGNITNDIIINDYLPELPIALGNAGSTELDYFNIGDVDYLEVVVNAANEVILQVSYNDPVNFVFFPNYHNGFTYNQLAGPTSSSLFAIDIESFGEPDSSGIITSVNLLEYIED